MLQGSGSMMDDFHLMREQNAAGQAEEPQQEETARKAGIVQPATHFIGETIQLIKGARSRSPSIATSAEGSVHDLLEWLSPRRSDVSADEQEPEDCCLCLEPVIRSAATIASLDMSQHDAKNAEVTDEHPLAHVCFIRDRTCADCLLDMLASYEQDYKKSANGCPCPLCKIPLREISQENMALRAMKRFAAESPSFRADCRELNSIVADATRASGHEQAQAQMRHRARQLLRSLAERNKTRKEELGPIKKFQSAPWYREARLTYNGDEKAFQNARENYRQLWPKESEEQKSERRRTRVAQGGWQAYDSSKWEGAGDPLQR